MVVPASPTGIADQLVRGDILNQDALRVLVFSSNWTLSDATSLLRRRRKCSEDCPFSYLEHTRPPHRRHYKDYGSMWKLESNLLC